MRQTSSQKGKPEASFLGSGGQQFRPLISHYLAHMYSAAMLKRKQSIYKNLIESGSPNAARPAGCGHFFFHDFNVTKSFFSIYVCV